MTIVEQLNQIAKPSPWIEDAKRRKKWRWLTKPFLRPRIKYYRMKRKVKSVWHENNRE